MNLELKRITFSPTFTIGTIKVGETTFWTLEDVVRTGPKVYGQTAIPKGRYSVIWNMSNRFKKIMPLLLDVPNFAGVRIHAGNTSADTEGCLLLGLSADRVKGIVYQSRKAIQLFEKLTEKKPFTLTIL